MVQSKQILFLAATAFAASTVIGAPVSLDTDTVYARENEFVTVEARDFEEWEIFSRDGSDASSIPPVPDLVPSIPAAKKVPASKKPLPVKGIFDTAVRNDPKARKSTPVKASTQPGGKLPIGKPAAGKRDQLSRRSSDDEDWLLTRELEGFDDLD